MFYPHNISKRAESPEHQAARTALQSRGRTWNLGPCPVEKSLVSQHIPVSDRLGTGWRGKPRALGTATRAGVLLPLDGLELLQWSGLSFNTDCKRAA